ncbi:substrate-binding periplasmic protein [Duganella sp. S19_KUP01_CR8]|uniref:substrate-binding periplasmic protein n=1 Tax=Duganella sp. S19_KUP01_CR8 TaxID=3025502 RepID=UPI002FCDC38A
MMQAHITIPAIMKLLAFLPRLSLLACLPAMAAASPPLELQIVHFPPYMVVLPGGAMDGIAVRPALAAFKKAGIEVTLREVPALRQLQRLKSNQERVCSVGWYKNRERQQFAKYSDALSQDTPWAAFANLPATPVGDLSAHAILANEQLTVLLKAGFIYGDYLDRAMLGMRARVQHTHADMPQVLRMIEVGRAQLTFAPIEVIQHHLKNYSTGNGETQIITFAEMPAGYKRYLMCSKQVEDGLIARFNAALAPARAKRAR